MQDSHVLDQHWKPVSVEPGKHCNWWEHKESGLCVFLLKLLEGCVKVCSTAVFLNNDGHAKAIELWNFSPVLKGLNACLVVEQRHAAHVKAY